jgi:antirestriction protein
MEQEPNDGGSTEYEREQAATRASFPWFGKAAGSEPPGPAGQEPPSGDEPPEPPTGEDGEALQPRPPQIWIGSLADYNAGNLFGKWIDASQDVERLQEEITAMLAESPTPGAEEWGIFDYEGFGAAGTDLGEYEPLDRISVIAKGIAEHGQAFASYVAYIGTLRVDATTADKFQEHFRGEWESVTAYAEHLLDETSAYEELHHVIQDLSERLQPYVIFDVPAYARDLELELHVVEHEGGVWVFDTSE